MSSRHLVVVGASLAGLRGAEAARRAGYDGRITLVGAEPHLPYDRPPLSKAHLEPGAAEELVPFRDRKALEELRLELALDTEATGLDTRARRLHTTGGDLDFSEMLIATGVAAKRIPFGDGLEGVHSLRTFDDARAIRDELLRTQRLVVIGAGFIGSEIASAARARGIAVTLVESEPVVLTRSLGPNVGALLGELHERSGTFLRLGSSVTGLRGRTRVETVELSDGTELEADLVVVGIGARPATRWLEGSGIALHPHDGGVVCDAMLFTNVPGIAAAGDVAHWINPLFGRSMRLEHWTNAAEQGARAAVNAIDPTNAIPHESIPYFWSDWYGSRIQFVGIPAEDEQVVVADQSVDGQLLVLYRRDDRLAGALSVNRPAQIMKMKRLISLRSSWLEAMEFVRASKASASLASS